MAAEAGLEGGAVGGRDAEGGEVEDSGEGFFYEEGVVLGLGWCWWGSFVEGRAVGEWDGGGREVWELLDGE